MWLLLGLAAIAGMLASWFVPAGERDSIARILPFVSLAAATFSVAVWWIASRLRRTDVNSVERFARRVFFTQQH